MSEETTLIDQVDGCQAGDLLIPFQLNPAWYAVLLEELRFASAVNGVRGFGNHHPKNAEALWKSFIQQGGGHVRDDEDVPEVPRPSASPAQEEAPAPVKAVGPRRWWRKLIGKD